MSVEDHRAAVEYDWRTRFNMGWSDVGMLMPWGEAIRLLGVLRKDPASHFAASVEKMDHPLSREGWMLADLIDVQGSSKVGKKWKPYPRPRKARRAVERFTGNTAGMTRAETLERLRALGHNLPPV